MAVKDAVATDAAEAPPKGKKKIIVVLAGLMLLLLGGGGTYMIMKPEGPPEPPKPGEVVKLDAIHVNLTDGHYLKLELALQAIAEAHEPPDGSKAMDLANRIFAEQSMADLTTTAAKDKVKKKLTKEVLHAYHGEVIDVYFRQFVMQ